jgi:hypothetical protein
MRDGGSGAGARSAGQAVVMTLLAMLLFGISAIARAQPAERDQTADTTMAAGIAERVRALPLAEGDRYAFPVRGVVVDVRVRRRERLDGVPVVVLLARTQDSVPRRLVLWLRDDAERRLLCVAGW